MAKALSNLRPRSRRNEGNPFIEGKWGEPTDGHYLMLGLSMFYLRDLLEDAERKLIAAYQTNDISVAQAAFIKAVDIMHTVVRDGATLELAAVCPYDEKEAFTDSEWYGTGTSTKQADHGR